MNEVILIAFWIGLLGGVHCLGMCGSIVGVITSNLPLHIKQNPKKLSIYHLFYNFGRIISYVLMGIIFASFSNALADQIGMGLMDKVFRIFSGLLMIMIGLFIAGWSNKIQIIEKLGMKLWVKIQPISAKFLPIRDYKSALFFGLFWGGIPCGLVYSALALTLGKSSIGGGLIMLGFGFGTLPALFAMSVFAGVLVSFMQKSIIKLTAGIIIIILGIWSLIMPVIHIH